MKKKILIIENDHDIRDIVELILAEEGFDTLCMAEPETLDVVMHFKPHLILIDEFINSKPGHRLCRKIKQRSDLNQIPVIILSTANDIELIAEECSANDFVSKPFDISILVDKVVRIIDGQPLPQN